MGSSNGPGRYHLIRKCHSIVLILLSLPHFDYIRITAQQMQLFQPSQLHQQLYPQNTNLALHARPSFYDPVLKAKSYDGYLPETASAGTFIRTSPSPSASPLQILVEDNDLVPGMPSAIYQYILTGYGADRFAVDQHGNLYLNSNDIDIDRSAPMYTLRVVARETDTEPIRTSVPITITIYIYNESELEPIPQSIYVANVSALEAGERTIAQIRINNQHRVDGPHAVHYRITEVSDDAHASFRYNEASSELIAVGPLVPNHIYRVTIEASDDIEPIAQAVVIVQAIAIISNTTASSRPPTSRIPPIFPTNNHNSPITHQQQFTTVIPLFHHGSGQQQQQSTQTVGFMPVSQQPQVALIPAYFATTSRPLVAVTKKSSTNKEHIMERNNELPEDRREQLTVELDEATPANSIISVLGDELTSGKVYFVIVGGNEAGKFVINADTGAVTTGSTVDREKQGAYHLQIQARSRYPDQLLYMTSLRVVVVDANDNAPEFTDRRPILVKTRLDGAASNIAKFAQPNLYLGKINVQDRDSGDNGRVSLRVLPPMDRLFSINDNGELRINGIPVLAHIGAHRLAIVASDHGTPALESRTVVTIQIESPFDTILKKSGIASSNQPLANAITHAISTSSGTTSEDYDMSSTGDSTEHKVSTAATPPYSQQNKPREIGTTFNPPPPEKSVASSTHVAFSRATFTTPHAPFTRLVSPPSTPTPSSEPPFLSPTKTTTTSEAPPPSTQKATTFERFSPPQPPKTPVATNQTEVSELLKQLSLLLPKLKPEVISKLSPSVFNPTPKPEIVEAETMETTTYTTTSVLPSTHTQEPSKREAPVFSAEQLRINISEVGKVSLPAMEAKYLDGKKGPIGYVLEAGDTSLFRVNSTTGELEVLRSLNAETQKVHHLRIGTEQANDAVNYARSSNVAFYSYNLTVVVVDVKEWTPRFDRDKYEFTFDVATKPHGEPIGKVVQDQESKSSSNRRVSYRIAERADGFDKYFAINPESGSINLARPLPTIFSGKELLLSVEASNDGEGKASSRSTSTQVKLKIHGSGSKGVELPSPLSSYPSEPKVEKSSSVSEGGNVQFSKRVYSVSLAEAERPPVVALTMQVTNKPRDIRFMMCAIRDGNLRGAFSVSPNAAGDCELRTQVQLDRETMEQYRLNISVESGGQVDFAVVQLSVMDANDNAPRFVFPPQTERSASEVRNEYLAVVSMDAPAFEHFFTITAEDADSGNNSQLEFSFDTSSPSKDWQNFVVGKSDGHISTKKPAREISTGQKDNCVVIVIACDNPTMAEQRLCSRAQLTINFLENQHRFTTVLYGARNGEIRGRELEMVKSLRHFTSLCSLISIEKIEKLSGPLVSNSTESKPSETIKISWYAQDPATRRLCKWKDFRKLFSDPAKAQLSKQWSKWADSVDVTANVATTSAESTGSSRNDGDLTSGISGFIGMLPIDWAAIPLMVWIIIGAFFAVLLGICILCGFRTWHDRSYRRRSPPRRSPRFPATGNGPTKGLVGNGVIYPANILDPVYNPNATIHPQRFNNGNTMYSARTIAEVEKIRGNENRNTFGRGKFYETQMLELPIGDDDFSIMSPNNPTNRRNGGGGTRGGVPNSSRSNGVGGGAERRCHHTNMTTHHGHLSEPADNEEELNAHICYSPLQHSEPMPSTSAHCQNMGNTTGGGNCDRRRVYAQAHQSPVASASYMRTSNAAYCPNDDDDELPGSSRQLTHCQIRHQNNQNPHKQRIQRQDEGDFSIDENTYAVNGQTSTTRYVY